VAVTGEEQGLYGSRHLAELAKEENWNIAAVT
jgi:Zn-dependent M28 family amino/carboxypeptidase